LAPSPDASPIGGAPPGDASVFALALADDAADAPRPVEAAPNARAALGADLAGHVARLLAAGDVEGARIAHEAMGRLLAAAAPSSGTVVDLAAERARRER